MKTMKDYAIGEAFESTERIAHFAIKIPRKWETGETHCGRAITVWARVTRITKEVTCPVCLAKMANQFAQELK